MKFTPLSLNGAYLIIPEKHEDNRGSFFRVFCKKEFEENNLNGNLNQSNISLNKKKGTLRGMHYQEVPYAEEKIVQCLKGAIYDVIVDIRPNSSTYLKWEVVELSEDNSHILYIPKGFAHGFQTLEDDSTILYFMTEKYNALSAKGFSYDDKEINIKWPIEKKIISEKDQNFTNFKL